MSVLLGVIVVAVVVAVAATAIGYTKGRADGENEARSEPRTWCVVYTFFRDDGGFCRYLTEAGEEYTLSKTSLKSYLNREELPSCPRRLRICFSQYLNEPHQILSMEEI